MSRFKVRTHYIVSAKNYVRCRVCNRRPKAHRNMYEVTATVTKQDYELTSHHGYMDTRKCADLYILREMGT